jgi:hydrogenase maturation protein HypF
MNRQPSERLRVVIRGVVQGVGFRPFVFRLATELGLAGWVLNSPEGVVLEVEGDRSALETFRLRLEHERPPQSSIHSLESVWLDPVGFSGFEIRQSEEGGTRQALIPPDIATCPDCLREILDPANRRFGHAFANCTNCGPRFTLIEALPYDRANTAMRIFEMCSECRAEYEDPSNRRFHAQPNSCPRCGPRLKFWTRAAGTSQSSGNAAQPDAAAIAAAARAIREGSIVAVKGVGGFHLMCSARDAAVVRKLRERKQREEKPFAVMFPSIDAIRAECVVSLVEEHLLTSPAAPIVLLRRRAQWDAAAPEVRVCDVTAPGNPFLGALLPSNPLHHLLLRAVGSPVVATSGNLSDEPICTDEQEAEKRLDGIADGFLSHNRPITRHADDSIVRMVAGRELVLRRARGYAPLPIPFKSRPADASPVLAVGAHLKNTVALETGGRVFISQHIGDLETSQAFAAFQRATQDLPGLYGIKPKTIVCDAHPDYLSTKFALESGYPTIRVQHHVAHVLACMAENELEPPVLGVSWDGTGYGTDGTVWGGEFFEILPVRQGREHSWQSKRCAHLRPFPLPGGEAAVREPRRAALGLLFTIFGEAAFDMRYVPAIRAFEPAELATLRRMLEDGINTPLTTSVGRLFDAVAALAGLRQVTRFEGQTAMALEHAAGDVETEETYKWRVKTREDTPDAPLQLDWQLLVEGLLGDVLGGERTGRIAVRFHNAMAEAVLAVATRISHERVALGGGCFQNRRLLERTLARLTSSGFRPYWPQRVPPNDGGIALGQVVAAARGLGVQ